MKVKIFTPIIANTSKSNCANLHLSKNSFKIENIVDVFCHLVEIITPMPIYVPLYRIMADGTIAENVNHGESHIFLSFHFISSVFTRNKETL